MNDTQKATLDHAVRQLIIAVPYLESICSTLEMACAEFLVETGIFDYEEGSVFADDVASLKNFQMEFDVLISTAESLSDIFANYAREGYEDHATV